MRRLTLIAALASAAALVSCDLFEKEAIGSITAPLPSARIKFFNFGVSAPGVNFYADDLKMSAISSTACIAPAAADTLTCRTTGIESTTGVNYGLAASGGLYMAIDVGSHTFTGRIAAATDKNLPIATVTSTIDAGKYYSYYVSGVYNTTSKSVDAFIVEDALPTGTIDFSVAQVRFVNAVSNGTGDLNLFATNTTTTTETAVGGATAYKAAGAFVALPAGTYNLRAAYTGAGTNVITRTGIALVGGRAYTIASRGSTATASTLGLDFTMNQW